LRACAGHATNRQVTTGTGEIATPGGAEGFARHWQDLRGDSEIQFTPLAPPKPPEVPDWWKNFVEWLGDLFSPVVNALAAVGEALGVSGPVFLWILGGIALVLLALLIWRFARGMAWNRKAKAEPEAEWTPDAAAALTLLEEADRLAAEGRFDEATRLLLKRSVGQIALARPGLLDPSSTAREIAALEALSQAARTAFATIAERVERSLFALRTLSADDWGAARAAYAEFAIAVPRTA
jgi:hypothetical protein